MDYEYFLKLAHQGYRFKHAHSLLVDFRWHSNSKTGTFGEAICRARRNCGETFKYSAQPEERHFEKVAAFGASSGCRVCSLFREACARLLPWANPSFCAERRQHPLLMKLKRLIRKTMWRLGWDLSRFQLESSPWVRLVLMLSVHGVSTVLDVGANTGQYAKSLRGAGFAGKIVSFEPVLEAHSQLSRAASNDSKWTVAERMAIGDRDGRAEIHVAGNLESSSLLPMLESHLAADPGSGFVATQTVPLARLDSVADRFLGSGESFFVKMDVQGFENKVLDGATMILKSATGLQLELSLIPLYEGEVLFQVMLEKLGELGFELWSLIPGFIDKKTGRLLQVDGVFFRCPGRMG
jgi:FkbM family methyltransferase